MDALAAQECDPRVILEHAGLPHRGVVLWLYATPQFRDKFKRDAAAGTRFWRAGTNLLAKLPKKPLRTAEQQFAADIILLRCRDARERFLAAHAGAVYRKRKGIGWRWSLGTESRKARQN